MAVRPEGALPVRPKAEKPPKRPFSYWRLLLSLLAGVAIAFLYEILTEVSGLSKATIRRQEGIALVLLLAALILFWLWSRRRSRFAKEAAALLPLLNTDVDAYIAGYEEMRGRWRGRRYQAYLCLNLTAGYIAKEDYAAAERLLHEAATYGLPGQFRTVWASDLAIVAFRQERWEEGLAVMEREKKAMEDLAVKAMEDTSGGEGFGIHWATLCLYRLVARGERRAAAEALKQAEEKWRGERAQKSFAHLHRLLDGVEEA